MENKSAKIAVIYTEYAIHPPPSSPYYLEEGIFSKHVRELCTASLRKEDLQYLSRVHHLRQLASISCIHHLLLQRILRILNLTEVINFLPERDRFQDETFYNSFQMLPMTVLDGAASNGTYSLQFHIVWPFKSTKAWPRADRKRRTAEDNITWFVIPIMRPRGFVAMLAVKNLN